MRAAGTLLVASLLPATSPRAAQQTPPRDVRTEAPAPIGTASLAGLVVTGDADARPLRMAHVVIIGALTGTLRVSSTDADGRFSFTGLPADRYVVGASRPPFLGAVAGAKRAGRPGTPIAVADGQKVTGVIVRLPPGASIAGVITDPAGQPASRATVALRQWRMQGGERTPVGVSGLNTSTDDRGRYRFFGLPPGEYILVGFGGDGPPPGARRLTDADVDSALKGSSLPAPPPDPQPVQLAPVYFPGTTREADAGSIVLSVGEERQGVDFRLDMVRTARVQGMVVTSDGQPATQVQISVGFAPPVVFSTYREAFRQDGSFAFPGLTPGSYQIVASISQGPTLQVGSAKVEVDGTDQSGIVITVRPAFSFTGRLVFDGASPPGLGGRRVPIRNLRPLWGSDVAISPTNASGTFDVTRVSPGRYMLGGPLFFGATNDSVTWALQSVVVDGRDVTDLPFDVDANQPPRDVVVSYGDRWQGLTGRLQLSTGTAATDYTVIVFPADRAYWLPGSRRILTSRPGTDGQYVLSGPGPLTLPAGEYLLAAVTDIGRDEQFDPAFLASLAGSAVRVTIGPGEPKRQDLVIR